jgi:hypothetical protein
VRAAADSNPPLCQVVRSIVDHVTALTQAPEIALPVVARIVIEVGSGQDHAGLTRLCRLHEVGPASGPAAAIAPTMIGSIKPTTIGQAANCHAVGAATSLTNAASALEPHPPADFGPIAGIELPHLTSDGHQSPVVATPVHKHSARSQSGVQCQAVAQGMEKSTVFCSLSKSKSGRQPNHPLSSVRRGEAADRGPKFRCGRAEGCRGKPAR